MRRKQKRLDACLEQKHYSNWKPIALAIGFLNKLEEKNTTNELELLTQYGHWNILNITFTETSSFYKQTIRHYYQQLKIT